MKFPEIINKYFFIIVFIVFYLSFIGQAQVSFTEHSIDSLWNEPWSIHPIDMDNDHDIDIVSSSRLGHKLAWWENDGNQGFTKHTISNLSYFAMGIFADDIDEDSDIDIFCASQTNGVELWVNQGDQTFVRQIVGNWPSASFLYGEDVDSDGDGDIIVSCCEGGSNRMGWIENLGGLQFSDHIVISNWAQANSAYAFDINRDGFMDLLGTSSGRETGTGEIAWFESDSNQVFTKHSIYSNSNRPSCAIALDLDFDQDIDIIASVCIVNQIIWFENTGNEVFVPNPIGYGYSRGLAIDTADFDNDGDIDILADAINADKIAWLENNGSQSFSQRIITTNFDGAADVFAADLDLDGDSDILATAHYADQLKWWENLTINTIDSESPALLSKFSLHQNYPNPFNPKTTIEYNLPNNTKVVLQIFDVLGKKVRTLVNMQQMPGMKSVGWDGKDNSGNTVTNGLYLYRMQTNDKIFTKKMLYLK